jgi:hypothetical protein
MERTGEYSIPRENRCYMIEKINVISTLTAWEPGWCSRCSDKLWVGRLKSRSSSPGTVKNFLFSKSFKTVSEAYPASPPKGT